MAVLLLGSVYILSGKGAELAAARQQEDRIVVLDPGHGGRDPGKVGVNQALEKDINLAIAGKTKKCDGSGRNHSRHDQGRGQGPI